MLLKPGTGNHGLQPNLLIPTLFVMAIVALAAYGSLRVYYLVDHFGTRLYWKMRKRTCSSARATPATISACWRYPLVAIGEYFNSPLPPSDVRAIGTVVRVASSGVDRERAPIC